MFKIEKQRKRLIPLRVMPPGSLAERHDIAELVSNSSAEFFAEAKLELFVACSKFSASDALPLQVDLLALDKEGRGVIVVTRQGNKQADLVTPMACAAVIAQWTPQEFLEQLSVERQETLKAFLRVGVDAINREQSVIVVAEDYTDEELTAVKWLRERHDIDIRCLRVVTAVDSEQNEYLSCEYRTATGLETHPTGYVNSESSQLFSVSSEVSSPQLASWASSLTTGTRGIGRVRSWRGGS